MKINLPATMDSFDTVNEFVRRCAQQAGFDDETVNKVLLVTEEIFVNVVNYAYEGGAGDLEIACDTEQGNALVLQFIDEGAPFDPLQVAEPDTAAPVEQRTIGGLGIFLVKKIMDTVLYRWENGKNILTMTKSLPLKSQS